MVSAAPTLLYSHGFYVRTFFTLVCTFLCIMKIRIRLFSDMCNSLRKVILTTHACIECTLLASHQPKLHEQGKNPEEVVRLAAKNHNQFRFNCLTSLQCNYTLTDKVTQCQINKKFSSKDFTCIING